MEILQEKYYGNSCWEISEHLKNDDSILRILAWQMKIDHKPIDKE